MEKISASKDLMPGWKLDYSWQDSGCSPQQGLAAMGELLGNGTRIDAVIGPGCSRACEVTSFLAGGQQVAQISYSCTGSSLSDKQLHPLFSRTVASDTSKGPALIAFMKHSRWSKIVILSSTDPIWLETGVGLEEQLEAANIEFQRVAFKPGSATDSIEARTMEIEARMIEARTHARTHAQRNADALYTMCGNNRSNMQEFGSCSCSQVVHRQ